ncbi:MAG: aspartate kinase [Christensenellaceae bacterium]|jgi:aspartate kinase
MPLIVTKFGGSSLADACQIGKVKKIIESNKDRRIVIPSAPGKSEKHDEKVTDMLYALQHAVEEKKEHQEIYQKIVQRYVEIRDECNVAIHIEDYLEEVLTNILAGAGADYAASRGEYLNGLIMADVLGFTFVDAADVIFFDKRGRYDEKETERAIIEAVGQDTKAVIPGFYGSMPDGAIKTFSRGGSDITGAIVSAALRADLYENWTDVSGFFMADPRIVKGAKKAEVITYRELRELSYMGASVLHEESIFPVYKHAIPINVRNTNAPKDSGTMIVPAIEDEQKDKEVITGIAGKKNFTIISIAKNGMNAELGFGRRVLTCIEKYSIPFEHMPSSIDTLCVVLEDAKVKENIQDIVDDIHRTCEPDSVEIIRDIALIATVGRHMIQTIGTAATLFTALANAGVNVRMIDQGSSELNIIVGVGNGDFENAINAIHGAFAEARIS